MLRMPVKAKSRRKGIGRENLQRTRKVSYLLKKRERKDQVGRALDCRTVLKNVWPGQWRSPGLKLLVREILHLPKWPGSSTSIVLIH